MQWAELHLPENAECGTRFKCGTRNSSENKDAEFSNIINAERGTKLVSILTSNMVQSERIHVVKLHFIVPHRNGMHAECVTSL